MKRLLISTAVILTILSISSCITSSVVSEEKRVSIFFSALNIGEDLQVEDNIINIREFKFALSKFNLFAEGDVVLQTTGDVEALIFAYSESNRSQRLILDVGLGFTDVENFTGYEMILEPVTDSASILDSDFFGGGENFSQVIRGTVNGTEFEFKSSISFDKFFEINGVQLTETEETLLITKFIDLEDVFVNSEGEFLDPTLEENEPVIMNNIKENLTVNFNSESII